MGYMMMQQADMMKGIADAMSASLAAANTDQNQNNINQYCIEQVYTNGTPVASCNPPASVTGVHDFESADAQGRIHNERIIREDGHVENDPGGPTP